MVLNHKQLYYFIVMVCNFCDYFYGVITACAPSIFDISEKVISSELHNDNNYVLKLRDISTYM